MIQRNSTYYPMTQTRARYRVVYGGAGSGKSVAVAQDVIDRAGTCSSIRVLILRKVYRTCRHSTFKLLKDILTALGRKRQVRINETEMTLRFPSGGEILHAGLDDVEKLKSISGITHIWVEEATELDFPLSETEEPDLAQIDLRLRGVDAALLPSITLTFNPTQVAAQIFDYVGVSTADLPSRAHREYQNGQVYVQHTTYQDNPFVGSEYVSVFTRIGGVMQAVYERGELVAIDAPDQLIKYEWVKAAFERDPADAWTDGRGRLSCDVARFGDDETVIGAGEGYVLEHVEAYIGQDTTTTGRRVATLGRERNVPAELAVVDTVGLGGGAADTARSDGYDVVEFIAGAAPVDRVEPVKDDDGNEIRPGLPDGLLFNNRRSQGWWYYRLQLEAGTIAYGHLSDTVKRKLQEDLLAPRYRIGAERRIEVEPKDSRSKTWGIKPRLGRSPDYGDMDMQRVFAEHLEPATWDYSRL